MVLETKIQAQIVAGVDTASFSKWEQLARDTGKKINQELKVKLELDIASAQVKLQQLKAQLKDKSLTDAQRIQLNVDTNQVQRSLTEAKRQLNNLVNTWDTWLSRLQAKFNGVWSSIKSAFSSMVSTVAIVTWIAAVSKAIYNLTNNLEQNTIAFTTMLWSAEKAKKLLTDLTKFASKTPFTITWIRDNAKQLLAMWVASENIIPTLKVLWDIAAWLWIPLERLSLAYGQVLAKGRLQGWELKQFLEAWVPLVDTLSKQLWVSTSEFYKMVEAGKVSSVDVTKWLQSMTEEWGKFFNLMINQSWSIGGLRSNVQDILSQVWEKIGTSLLPKMKSFVNAVLDIANQYWDSIATVISEFVWSISEVISEAVDWITELFNALSNNTNKAANDQLTFVDIILWAFRALTNWVKVIVFWVQSVWKVLWSVLWFMFVNLSNIINSTVNAAIKWINFISQWLNKLAWTSFKKIELFKISAPASFSAEMWDAFKEIWKDFDKLDIKSLKVGKSLWSWVTDAIGKINLDKINAATKDTTWKWAWTAKKDAEELKKLLEDAQKIQDSIVAKWWKKIDVTPEMSKNKESVQKFIESLKSYEWAIDEFTKKSWTAYDELGKKIDQSIEKQKTLKQEIAWIETDIASRVVEIDKQIAELDKKRSSGEWITSEDILSQQKLNAERAKAFEWLTPEAVQALKDKIKEVADYEALTEVEKLQKKLLAKQNELAAEILIETWFNDERKALLDDYEAYLQEKVAAESAMANQLKQQWLEVARARSAAWAWGGGSLPWRATWWPVSAWSPYIVWEKWPELFVPENNWRIVPNHQVTVNQNVNANVANDVDIDTLANALARKITLAGKWIL